MNSIKRRTFLKSGVAASALGFPALGQVRGANDRVQVALIGCGGRGTQVTASLAKRSDVECGKRGRPDVAEERSDAGHKALGFASAEAAVVLFQGEIDGHRRGHRSLHASATSVTAA